MSTGYLAAFATLFCWTISTFVLARLSRLENSHILNKAVLFFSIILLGFLVCILDNLTPIELFTLPTGSNWIWLSVSGILGKSVGDFCGYKAIRILGPRRRSMITTLGPGFTWIFGLIILYEKMNWIGVGAMMLTIFSIVLLINNNAEKTEVKLEKYGLPLNGLLFGIAGALLTGLAFILAKMTIVETGENISAFHGTWMRIISAFLALMVIDLVRRENAGFVKQFITDKDKGLLLFLTIHKTRSLFH